MRINRLTERQMIKSLVLESEGLLTEGMMSDIFNFIKRKISPEKQEELKEKLSNNLGVDENSSKEDIEQAILEKTDGGSGMSLLKKVLKEILGFGAFMLVWDITNYILAAGLVASDFNPVVIIATVIFIIFKNSNSYEKVRRKALGSKVDKFIFGKRDHLGDFDNKKDKEDNGMNESRKKINRLTERDLTRIVKRVIKEEEDDNKKESKGMSITIKDVFDEVVNALKELGGYDESMKGKAMKLAKDIIYKMQDDLAYISEDYEEQLYEILGEENF